jgi:HK97 family phage major capsid protein
VTIRISDQQGLALRKHALPTLRKLGVKDGADYLPHKLDWNTLQDHGKEALKSCRSITNSIKDDAPAEEARSVEDAYEGMIEIFDAIENEKNVRGILKNREARDSDVNPMRPMPSDGETRGADDGETYASRSGWSDKQGAEIRVLTPKQPFATSRRVDGPSLGDCLRAMIAGPRNQAERRALSEGTDSAGGFTVPLPLAMEFIDKLRARSVVIAAGARTIDMTSETLALARLDTDPTFAWRAENTEVMPSDPTFSRVLLTAKSLSGMVKVSRELVEDSNNVSAALENAFMKGMALEFDRAALYGTGGDQPTGVALTSGINSVSMGTNGAALSGYDSLIDTIYEMQLDNAADPTAMIYHPRTGVTLAKMKDGEGNPIIVPKMVADVPRLVTTSMPINEAQGTATTASSILFGDWRELLIGLRASLRVGILRERFAEFHQYAFISYMRGDVQLAHANSFSRLKGIIP